jgi:UDP-glucose 4-epimerase
MQIAWILGEGGLLGSGLKSQLERRDLYLFSPVASFSWNDTEALYVEFRAAIDSFSQLVSLDDHWTIFWAAGISNMHSTEEELHRELSSLQKFLDLLHLSQLDFNRGMINFSSSAGAIYAGSHDGLISEDSPTVPINPYGRGKLLQEKMLEESVKSNPKLTLLISRISTLFGSRSKGKSKQGLLAEICRRIINNESIHIYVPLDTMRDFIHIEDASINIINASNAVQKLGGVHIKIIACEKLYSIAEIIAIFKRLTRRNIRAISYLIESSKSYQKPLQFKSRYLVENSTKSSRNLIVGISQLLEQERMNFRLSK